MKTLRVTLIILLFPFFSDAQIYTHKDIPSLLQKSKKDSVAKIERLAALEFHKLINEYREDNNLNTLDWDETLWVTTNNHNAWMSEAENLSHHQTSRNKYSTGNGPGDRFNYAAGGNAPNGWSGENALYNYSAYGKTIAAIAKNIASSSFKQWKNSPGHNRNMLGKNHVTHGTAFKITNEKVWGTDLFASGNRPYQQKQSNKPFYTKAKRKRFSTAKARQDITKSIYSQLSELLGFKPKKVTYKNGVAKNKARNLLAKKFKNDNEILLSKQKNATTSKLLGFISKKRTTYSLIIEKKITDFNSETITEKLTGLIRKNQTINRKSKLDIGIAVKRKKDVIRITLVCIVHAPKSAIHLF